MKEIKNVEGLRRDYKKWVDTKNPRLKENLRVATHEYNKVCPSDSLCKQLQPKGTALCVGIYCCNCPLCQY